MACKWRETLTYGSAPVAFVKAAWMSVNEYLVELDGVMFAAASQLYVGYF